MGLGLDQPSHWVIIAIVALLLFGYKKLPEMARSAGKSMRIFKTELKGMAKDDDDRSAVDHLKSDATPEAANVAEAKVAVANAAADEATAKAAEVKAAEDRAAALRAELAAAEQAAARLKTSAIQAEAAADSPGVSTPRAS